MDNVQNLFCKYCGKRCKNENSLRQHSCRCHENPNRIKTNFESQEWRQRFWKGPRNPWNKGLTKNTDERVNRVSNRLKEIYAKQSEDGIVHSGGRASSEEGEGLRRQRISKSMKNNGNSGGLRLKSGIGKKGWYKGYFCDSTYELVYVIYNIDHNIPFIRNNVGYEYQYNGQSHKYFPDFLENEDTLIEIKGYVTDLVNVKLSSVRDKPIKLLTFDDLKYAFDYVKQTYQYDRLSDLYE